MSDIFLIQKSTLTNTANAIREHISDKSEISPADFPGKIDAVYNTGHDEGYAKGLSAGESGVTFTTRAVDPTTITTTYNASDDNANGYSAFTVNAIPKQYVDTTNITKDSDDLSVSDNTISVPMGYYPNGASADVATAERAVPSIEISANGKITAKAVQTTGWVTEGTESKEYQLSSADNTDFIAENIRSGKTIFGVEGSLVEGEVLPEFDEVDDFELDVLGLDTELEVSYSVSEKVALPAGHHLLTYIEDTNFTPSNIKKGVNIFGLDGDYEGEGGIDTSDATATAAQILRGKTAYVNGEKLEGTMADYTDGFVCVLDASRPSKDLNGAYLGEVYIEIDNPTITTNGTYKAPSGTVMSEVIVNVPSGEPETWDGSDIAITETVPTITFYIGNGSSAPMNYYAKEGMTWYKWCQDPNYNTAGATCAGEGDGSDVYIGNEQVWGANGSAISGGTVITDGAEYITKP